jgi:hypothetical protein
VDSGGHIGPFGGQKVPPERAGRGKGDAVHHPVKAVHVLGHPPGQRFQLGGVGHVQLEHGRRLGQPFGDPLHQGEAPEPGQHQGRALLLGDPRHVEGDRGVGQHSGDQDPLAVQDAHRCSLRQVRPVLSRTV